MDINRHTQEKIHAYIRQKIHASRKTTDCRHKNRHKREGKNGKKENTACKKRNIDRKKGKSAPQNKEIRPTTKEMASNKKGRHHTIV